MKALSPGDRYTPLVNICPDDWTFTPVKYVVDVNGSVLPETTDPDMAFRYVDIGNVSYDGSWNASEPMTFSSAPSRARRVLRNGDVVISTVRTYLGAIAFFPLTDETLVCSTGFIVLSPKLSIYPRFLAYWVRSIGFIDEVVARSTGVSYPAINPFEIGSLPVPNLPLSIQRAIAAFLDRKTVQIDALIAAYERLVALLEEKRQAVITQAVTKGLDPTVPMKDSGVPWLGEVPGHWVVKRLKFIAKVRTGLAKGRDLLGQVPIQMPYLRVANVQDGYVDLSDVADIAVLPHEVEQYRLRDGDVLMNEGGDNDKLGRGVRWHGEIDPCLHQNHVFCVRPMAEGYSDWLDYYSSSTPARVHFAQRAKQTTNLASISSTNVKELPVPVPPMDERSTIQTALSRQLDCIKATKSAISKQIDLLKEYRPALITAAVTGQIDVREEEVPDAHEG